MNKKIKIFSIFVMMLSALLCITTFVYPTISKYVSNTNAPFEGDETLDYTVNSVFEVKNQDELFAAINQGYTYVQLSKDIENPLIVTEQAETLDADLILDLNGIEIQRNGYDPILNVKEGVRLTVVDTSSEQTGGLYNPVGSVFNITGGILTVVTGTFESGPRYSEYYSYNTNILNSGNNTTKRTVVEPAPQNVNYYLKQSDGTFSAVTTKSAPIIKSYPTVTGDVTYNHGNLYFDHTVSLGDLTITPDTYCYYRTSEDKSATDNSAVACDWYYSYWVEKVTYNYIDKDLPAGADEEDYILITIYGYEKAIQKAAEKTNPAEYYAAIQMQSGTLEVQSGGFHSYFGVDTTACVNSQGGEIEVKSGQFSSRVPDAMISLDDGVNIKEDDSLAFGAEYFRNYRWSTEANGNLAKQGESYCILNGGEAIVNIGNGQLYSSDNSTIHMEGGVLDIGAGTITKKTTVTPPTGELTSEQTPYFSAIYMKEGVLTVSNASFNVFGDKAIGVYMIDGNLSLTNATCRLTGDDVYGIMSTVSGNDKFVVKNSEFDFSEGIGQTGIYAQNGRVNISADIGNAKSTMSFKGDDATGIKVENNGSVNSDNYNYIFEGDQSYGIYSEGGIVQVSSSIENICSMSMMGLGSCGIYVTGAGSSVTSHTYDYKFYGDQSYGIYSIAGLVKIKGGNITLVSNNQCYGVYAFSATEQIQIDIDGATIDVGYDGDDKTADTLASVGVFLATNDNTNKITLTDTDIKCYEVGVLIDGGSLDVKSTTTTANEISTKKASSIIVKGGNVLFDSTCNYNITSSNTIVFTAADTEDTLKTYDTNLYDITIPELAGANIGFVDYKNTDGIYVEGGNFTVNGAVSITHTGLANDFDLNTAYATQIITSYAVRVTGGKVVIVPSNDAQNVKITANVGGGVFCGKSDTKNGELVLGRENAANSTVEVNALGNRNSYRLYQGETGNIGNGSGWNWSVPVNLTGGNAVELNGGSITLNCGTYSANFGNGILAKIPYQAVASASDYSYPTITVNNGIFKGQMNLADTIYNRDLDATDSGFSGPASSYGIKVVGGADVQLFNGVYSGAAGGVMITGISDYDNYDGNWAKLRLYGGVYGCDSTTNFANASTDGIMIFDKSLIAIGGYDSANSDKANVNNLTIIAILCPISANPLPLAYGKTRVASEVNIYYSKFIYDQAVIYNEGGNSATIKVYNRYNTNMYLQQDIGQRGDQGDGTHTVVTHTGTKYFAVTDYSTTAQPYWNASTTTTN